MITEGKRRCAGTDGDSLRPGEYMLTSSRKSLWFNLPNGLLGRINVTEGDDPGQINGSPTWGFTEHDDGTITVSPSIWHKAPPAEWHGFLEHGQWRQV